MLLVISLSIAFGWLPAVLLGHLQTFSYNQTKLPFLKHNAIVLLGAGAVKIDSHHFLPALFSYSRIDTAATTYFACKKVSSSCIILISGGDPKPIGKSEAAVYTNELIKLGVNKANIKLESQSRNTYENAKYSSKILKQGNFDQIFLVSSGYHLKRSMILFSHFGISAIPVPADYVKADNLPFHIAYNLILTELTVHEYLGILEFKFRSRFTDQE